MSDHKEYYSKETVEKLKLSLQKKILSHNTNYRQYPDILATEFKIIEQPDLIIPEQPVSPEQFLEGKNLVLKKDMFEGYTIPYSQLCSLLDSYVKKCMPKENEALDFAVWLLNNNYTNSRGYWKKETDSQEWDTRTLYNIFKKGNPQHG